MPRLAHRAFLCLLTLLVLSTSLTLRAERLPIRAYTTADGLPHNSVMRIVADSRGFLWFCTMGGLARFAGDTCVSFATEEGLPADRVNDLLETHGLTFRTRAHRRGP